MRLQKAAPSKLILTEQETIVLREAKDFLNEIATLIFYLEDEEFVQS